MKIWANTVVHNEENFIWFAIMSVVDYVDKVLVYDTGSTDQTVSIIKEIKKAYQESYREKWCHSLAKEITIDILPGLPPYSEIECKTENELNKMIEILKLDKSKMRFGAFDKTYNEYYDIPTEIINNKTPSLTFENIINEIKPIKNQDLLQKIYELYKPKKISRNKSKKVLKKNLINDTTSIFQNPYHNDYEFFVYLVYLDRVFL